MIKKDPIKLTKNNVTDIVRCYCHRLLDDMDIDSLYSLAYSLLVENKLEMSMKSLSKEIKDYAPDLLEYQP